MGQAKRKKDLGLMPEQSTKPRKTAHKRISPEEMLIGFYGSDMNDLLLRGALGGLFQVRQEMVKMNLE